MTMAAQSMARLAAARLAVVRSAAGLGTSYRRLPARVRGHVKHATQANEVRRTQEGRVQVGPFDTGKVRLALEVGLLDWQAEPPRVGRELQVACWSQMT